MIGTLEEYFGRFSVTRGKQHNYLGMKITLQDYQWVEVDMSESMQCIIDDFSEKLSGTVTSPVTVNLYVQDKDAKPLSGAKKEELHSVTQKLLHVCKQARLDIETTIAYLTTRVTKSTTYDWWK